MAWTTPKTWSAGETLTAANFNTHIRDNLNAIGPLFRIRKTADESVTSNATPQNDDHLFFAIGASEVWAVQCVLFWTDNNVANSALRVGWSVPASCTGTYTLAFKGSTSGALMPVDPTALGTNQVADRSQTADQTALVWATIVNSTTAGTVNFQWAQSVSSGTATTVKTNSTLLAHRIA
jgi:hypothetical protein